MIYFFLPVAEKTKALLFNGAKAVVGKIWTGDETSSEPRPTGHIGPATGSQTLLRGQTLIGHDGRLTKAARAQGENLVDRSINPTLPYPS